ncbi:hypothetical protein BHE74_00057984, partial [Ensete ventricosum]
MGPPSSVKNVRGESSACLIDTFLLRDYGASTAGSGPCMLASPWSSQYGVEARPDEWRFRARLGKSATGMVELGSLYSGYYKSSVPGNPVAIVAYPVVVHFHHAGCPCALSRSEDDGVENSPGVRRELAKDVKSLPGWRKGVRQKKTKTRRKIIGGSRKACRELGIGLGLDDVVGPRHDFARRFAEGIGKLAGNTSIDHRKKTRRLFARIQEVVRLAGGLVFTQRRTVVDASVPQGGGLGSGHRCWETSA